MNSRKKYQRKFNKLLRHENKNLEKDELWQGRFYFKQIEASFEKFNDSQEGILYVTLRGVDKQTGYFFDKNIEYAPYLMGLNRWHLIEFINDFIVNRCEAWENSPIAADYTKVKIDENIWKYSYNWFLNYSVFNKERRYYVK
jgi:hypothetical protein